jgi:hypothetical protein
MGKYTDKQRKKILKDYNYRRIESMSLQELYAFVKDLFPTGTKFYNRCYDEDPWYVVSYVEDGNIPLIVVKSWSKYKQYWCYKIERLGSFLYMISALARE